MDLKTKRIKNELRQHMSNNKSFATGLAAGSTGEKTSATASAAGPLETIFVFPDDANILKGYAIIMGPDDTPYARGLFLFSYEFPQNYPFSPPAVKLLTTGRKKKVRFNPNLYACGKVCLSILGTWEGPSWTQALTLESVLISIQSLMGEEPFYNEPGYEGRKMTKESRDYNEVITYYTMTVAAVEQAERAAKYPTGHIRDMVSFLFLKNFDFYKELISKKIAVNDVSGRRLRDHHGAGTVVILDYEGLLKRLEAVKKEVLADERAAGSPLADRIKKFYH